MKTLPRGEYIGRVLGRRQLFGLPLTLTAYAAGHVYGSHVHEVPTLFVLFAGQHHDETRQVSFDQPPLSVVFHPTTEPHTTHVGPDGLIGLNLELTDNWLARCHLRARDLAGEYRLLDSPWARLLGLRLAALAYAAPEENGREPAGDPEMETAVLELLTGLLPSREPTRRAPHWLPRAEEFLRTYFHTSVRLRDVAAEVGVHPIYCARAFRRALGCTVSEYIRTLRLVDAGRLILSEERSLAEIALRAGFADQAHLTRTFSGAVHATPGRLKRAVANGSPGR